MWSWLKDDGNPQIRRSIVSTSAILSFVCIYDVDVKLPSSVFEVEGRSPVISAETSVLVFGSLLLYLLARYLINTRANWLARRAERTGKAGAKAEAEHYFSEIEKLKTHYSSLVSASFNKWSSFEHASEKLKGNISDFFFDTGPWLSNVNKMNQLMREFEKAKSVDGRKLYDLEVSIGKTLECLEPLGDQLERLRKECEELDEHVAELSEFVLTKGAMKTYEFQVNDAYKSERLLALDSFLISQLLVAAPVAVACYTYLSWSGMI